MSSLVDKVDAFATRVAEEFNSVRTEMDAIGVFFNVDGGAPSSVFASAQTRFDGGGP